MPQWNTRENVYSKQSLLFCDKCQKQRWYWVTWITWLPNQMSLMGDSQGDVGCWHCLRDEPTSYSLAHYQKGHPLIIFSLVFLEAPHWTSTVLTLGQERHPRPTKSSKHPCLGQTTLVCIFCFPIIQPIHDLASQGILKELWYHSKTYHDHVVNISPPTTKEYFLGNFWRQYECGQDCSVHLQSLGNAIICLGNRITRVYQVTKSQYIKTLSFGHWTQKHKARYNPTLFWSN